MKAIILAGGKGTRLQSVISDVPKPMAPVSGKPFLEYLVLQLKFWNVRDIILSVGYKKESIMAHFADGSAWDVRISYVQENAPLGTGGAIRETLQTVNDNNILIMNGDSFFNANISNLIHFHNNKNARATLMLRDMTDTGRYGRVALGKDDTVIEFTEKQGNVPGLINAGIYLIDRDVLPMFPEGASSFENDILPRLIGKGLYGHAQEGFFVDIGLPDDYRSINEHSEKLFSRRKP